MIMTGARRIDVHAHYFGGRVAALLDSRPRLSDAPATPPWTPESALALMEQNGIATQLLSLPFTPVSPDSDPGFAAAFARQVNQEYAKLMSDRPGRFGAFAAVPGDSAEAMVSEIGYALDTLNLDGVALNSNVQGQYWGSALLEPVLAELDRRQVPVLIHPTDSPHAVELALGRPRSVVEFPFDTARNITNALYTGVFERYPNLRLILPHCGGPLPTLAWRIGVNTAIGRGPQDAVVTAEHVSRVLKGLYYDTAMAGSRNSLLPVLEVTDSDHLLLGTDWPAAPEPVVTENLKLLTSFGFAPDELERIEHGTARRLFPRLS